MEPNLSAGTYSCFEGHLLLVSGPIPAVALRVKHALEQGIAGPLLIIDNHTGSPIDIDTRGSDDEVIARFTPPAPVDEPRGRGRPKLGVTPREVTLLPRHWEWLAQQPGGASVTLRKLVEEARRTQGGRDKIRQAQERTYHFMSAIAGDMPNFEEATRALFADDRAKFNELIALWPQDVREHASWLAFSSD